MLIDCSGNDQLVRRASQGFRRQEAYRSIAKSLFPARVNYFSCYFSLQGFDFVYQGVPLRWKEQTGSDIYGAFMVCPVGHWDMPSVTGDYHYSHQIDGEPICVEGPASCPGSCSWKLAQLVSHQVCSLMVPTLSHQAAWPFPS